MTQHDTVTDVLQLAQDKRIAVLAGGQSGEREVSLRSGAGVLEVLQAEGLDALMLDPQPNLAGQLLDAGVDVAFNALHGGAGEDGTVQGVLEMLGMPYTGCGVLASALTMDKLLTQTVLQAHGLQVPDYEPLCPHTTTEQMQQAVQRLGIPVVAKPACEGSSLGVVICRSEQQALEAAVATVGQYGRGLLESFVDGTEITVGVLGWCERTRSLPVLEIVPRREFYDYEAKYTRGMTELICPARIPQAAAEQAMQSALHAHRAVGAHGISRCDMHLDSRGQVWIHEINSMPGLTETSDVPHEALAIGMTYRDLVLEILGSAFFR
jgi:D-alanine-D-alanine ligase